jgi:hypothetical protein
VEFLTEDVPKVQKDVTKKPSHKDRDTTDKVIKTTEEDV